MRGAGGSIHNNSRRISSGLVLQKQVRITFTNCIQDDNNNNNNNNHKNNNNNNNTHTHTCILHYIHLESKINESGLFAWINLTALSRTLFIKINTCIGQNDLNLYG